MWMWITAGYVMSAIAFYTYIVKTAQDEPQERAFVHVKHSEIERTRGGHGRRAA